MGELLDLKISVPPVSAQPITIDIVSDVICPWCFIGKRRLEKALAQLPEVHARVRWRPFLLDPTIPEGGMDRATYLTHKFGPEGGKAVYNRIRVAGAEEGIAFAFEKIRNTPNTTDAHRLLHWADREGTQDEVAERLFQLYFLEGEDIGNRDVLAKAAAYSGMDEKVIRKRLDTGESRSQVLRQAAEAQDAGIAGVPCFIFNQGTYLPGAQSALVVVEAIRRIVNSP